MTGSFRKIKLGYGFIAGVDGIDYFFHWSNLSKFTKQLRYCVENEPVTFEVLISDRGPRAIDIEVVGHTITKPDVTRMQ
jgi:cold shock CspA family protein